MVWSSDCYFEAVVAHREVHLLEAEVHLDDECLEGLRHLQQCGLCFVHRLDVESVLLDLPLLFLVEARIAVLCERLLPCAFCTAQD